MSTQLIDHADRRRLPLAGWRRRPRRDHRHLHRGPHGPRRDERIRQVDPSAAHRRSARPDDGHDRHLGRGRLPAADADPRARVVRRRPPRDRAEVGGPARHRIRATSTNAISTSLGDDWDLESRAGEALRELGLHGRRSRSPRRRHLGRRDRARGDRRPPAASRPDHPARRAHEQPGPAGPSAPLGPCRLLAGDARRRQPRRGPPRPDGRDGRALRRRASRPSADRTAPGASTSISGRPRRCTPSARPQQAVRVEKRQRIEAESKLAGRARAADKNRENRRAPKIIMNGWASDAQVSAGACVPRRTTGCARRSGRSTRHQLSFVTTSTSTWSCPTRGSPAAGESPNCTGRPARSSSRARNGSRSIGANGVGKTTLLEQLVEGRDPQPGQARGLLLTDRVGYLSQRLDRLDGSLERARERGRGRAVDDAGRSCGTSSPACCCAGTRCSGRSTPCRAASASASRSRDCCSPTRPPSCSCSTSRRTTSTSRLSTSSSMR